MLQLNLKTTALGLCLVALAACNPGGTSAQVSASATAKTIVMPIRTSQIQLTYDPATPAPVATVAYSRANVPLNEYLNINQELYPAIRSATGCTPQASAGPNQLLPPSQYGVTRIPLQC